MDDIKSLFYSIVAIAGAELKWINMQDKDLLPLKIDFDANRVSEIILINFFFLNQLILINKCHFHIFAIETMHRNYSSV